MVEPAPKPHLLKQLRFPQKRQCSNHAKRRWKITGKRKKAPGKKKTGEIAGGKGKAEIFRRFFYAPRRPPRLRRLIFFERISAYCYIFITKITNWSKKLQKGREKNDEKS
jgi:hypothetical protein